MKKILILVLLISLITSGCVVKKKEKNDIAKDNTELKGINNNDQDKIYQEYQQLLNDNKRPEQLISYIEDNILDMDIDKRDEMIDELILTQGYYLEEFNNRISTDEISHVINNYTLEELNNLNNIKEDQLNAFIKDVRMNGYMLTPGEDFYVEIDPKYIIDQFGKQLSEEMNEYLAIMETETYKHFAVDGGISIDWDQLADRIVRIEKYLKKYNESIHRQEMDYLNNIYRRSYVAGMDNSPVFVGDNGDLKLSKDVKESYDRTLVKHKGTKIHDLITQYIRILDENNYKKTIAVERFIEENASLGY